MNTKELNKKLQELEEKYFNHAQNLEFEQAAHLRDRSLKSKKRLLKFCKNACTLLFLSLITGIIASTFS